ncbi:ankyrin [Aspergillus heteromorphus CBS 117.55]|uniref:Ankyrin n=1 Tax=Aspergillus heteromorphus CBS 117.55 TaxID=1448321 RepID=A0A317VT17_9EURO|nr:ankyrin [Aspergillus heteromorphus CBS 117.55]PWY75070.1 ankyrin [Aspergillus heteromorphus CBS 117.55]
MSATYLDHEQAHLGQGIGNMPLELCLHLTHCKRRPTRDEVQLNPGVTYFDLVNEQARDIGVRGFIPGSCPFEYDFHPDKPIINGRPDLLDRHLQAGLDPNSLTQGGITLLSLAVAQEQLECVRVLIHHGAHPNNRGRWRARSLDYVSLLYANNIAGEMVRTLLVNGAIFRYPSAFSWFTRANSRRHMERIITNGAPLADIRYSNGDTVLHYAVRTYTEGRLFLDALLEADYVPELVNVGNEDMDTPVHLAQHVPVLRKLLSVGGSPNTVNIRYETPLHMAITNARHNVIQMLIEHPRTDIRRAQTRRREVTLTAYAIQSRNRNVMGVILRHRRMVITEPDRRHALELLRTERLPQGWEDTVRAIPGV